MDHVRGAVIRTLAFQAAWGYAPTRLQLAIFLDMGSIGVETQNFASNSINTSAAMYELDRLIAEGIVCESRGHIVLKSFVEQIDRGREKEFYFPRKLRHARRVVSYLSRLPWVRAVCLCNTTALGQARDEGDLDFFIIAKAGSIWRTRFFATLPFKLLGTRPSRLTTDDRRQTTDPICLSFFVTDDALNLSNSMLSEDDPYFRYWFLSLLPLTDDGVLKELWEQNLKIRQRHPLAKKWMALDGDDLPKSKGKYKPIVESWLEKKLKILQQRQFPAVIKEAANQGTRVVVSDQMLKFHVEDRRSEYRQKYYEICKQFGVNP
ncbi:MAG: hypothetical protein WC750_05835 [Patescibacteria group bacterium]|jgi:hypothetical protein